MEMSGTMKSIELVAKGLEYFGVAVISIAFIFALIRSLLHFGQRKEGTFERLKGFIGKALQLGLEFLVAADIIRTVTMEPTREGILALGMLIVVRTFLSWSITVEIEGCWPWQVSKLKKE
jgi:uncharacterized membrane protein